jgi:hypothetical protein
MLLLPDLPHLRQSFADTTNLQFCLSLPKLAAEEASSAVLLREKSGISGSSRVENAESHVKIRILDPDFPQFAEKPTLIFGVAAVYFCDNRCFQKESKNSKFYQDLES